jgi:hypothetical protein
MTNRDLYLAIADLKDKALGRQLEDYLCALYLLATEYKPLDQIGSSLFLDLITRAFTTDIAPFASEWSALFCADSSELAGFERFESTILSQIVDLHEMAGDGRLDNDLRYLGIQSPRGRDWYNFDPSTYLECAVEGSVGGWEPGDSTGREFVQSQAIMPDGGRNTGVVEPRDVECRVFQIATLSWEQFAEFLELGRLYE